MDQLGWNGDTVIDRFRSFSRWAGRGISQPDEIAMSAPKVVGRTRCIVARWLEYRFVRSIPVTSPISTFPRNQDEVFRFSMKYT
jgi:hypothetical protein